MAISGNNRVNIGRRLLVLEVEQYAVTALMSYSFKYHKFLFPLIE